MLCVHINYAHSLLAWISPDSGMANQGMMLLQMGNNNTANHGNEGHGAQLPPSPSLTQAIAALIADRNEQTELLRQLVQSNTGRGRQAPPAETDYVGFLATQPPLFHKAEDPLEADAWIRTMEDKFGILNCTEVDKAAFVVQQLRGPAKIWWANYLAMQPTERQIPWSEFREIFRAHYIPEGFIKVKVEEFLNLKQENKSVMEYANIFNHLAQYAAHHVDTDEKKQDCFQKGLNTELLMRLAARTFTSYSDLVSKAILQEDAMLKHEKAKKRKKSPIGTSGNVVQRLRLVPTSFSQTQYQLQQGVSELVAPLQLEQKEPVLQHVFLPP